MKYVEQIIRNKSMIHQDRRVFYLSKGALGALLCAREKTLHGMLITNFVCFDAEAGFVMSVSNTGYTLHYPKVHEAVVDKGKGPPMLLPVENLHKVHQAMKQKSTLALMPERDSGAAQMILFHDDPDGKPDDGLIEVQGLPVGDARAFVTTHADILADAPKVSHETHTTSSSTLPFAQFNNAAKLGSLIRAKYVQAFQLPSRGSEELFGSSGPVVFGFEGPGLALGAWTLTVYPYER